MDTHITYQVKSIHDVDALRRLFPTGAAEQFLWCFVGTGGVHGTHTTLSEAEESLSQGKSTRVTVLVVHPREVCTRYGSLQVNSQEDLSFIRRLAETTREHCSKVGF